MRLLFLCVHGDGLFCLTLALNPCRRFSDGFYTELGQTRQVPIMKAFAAASIVSFYVPLPPVIFVGIDASHGAVCVCLCA